MSGDAVAAPDALWEGLGHLLKNAWRRDQKFMVQDETRRLLQDTWLGNQLDRRQTVGLVQYKVQRYAEQIRVAKGWDLYPLAYPVLHGDGSSFWERNPAGTPPDSHTISLTLIRSSRTSILTAFEHFALPGFVKPLQHLIADYARPIRFCTAGQDLPEPGTKVAVMDKQANIILMTAYVFDHKGGSPGHLRVWNGKDEDTVIETVCWRLFISDRYFRDYD